MKQYEEAGKSKEPYRPPLEGHSALVAAITGLRNDIRRVNGLPRIEGPKTPIDEAKERQKAYSDRRMDAALGYDEEVT
ncbi:Uncharacterised protein [Mycobacteroides abscessus]|nr:hypothetical protein [Mycobacteroides abscessus]CPZ91235.1 Uncharacterised protein [Mycobacteroides abscessus]